MKIKKVSGTAVLNGNVVDNLTNNSTTNAPSQRAVKELVKYSTDEIVVGTWMDGKPIYRIVKTFTNYNTLKQGTTIPCSIPNVETVTHQYYQYEYGDEKRVFPLIESTGNVLGICFKPVDQKLFCSGAGSWSARPLTAIIEYTKTTDV